MTTETSIENTDPAVAVITAPPSSLPALPKEFAGYATLAKRLSTVGNALATNIGGRQLSEFALDRIKAPSGGAEFFTIPSVKGPTPAKDFSGIIVHSKTPRAFWENAIGIGGNKPPDCRSEDGVRGVGRPGGDCSICPFAQYGSKVNERGESTGGQACRSIHALYVLRPGALLPVVVPLPPTSLKFVDNYFLRLVNEGLEYWQVTTRFKLEKANAQGGMAYSRIVLELDAELPDAMTDLIQTYRDAIVPLLKSQSATRQDFA